MTEAHHHPDGVVETHVSRLVFLGDRVYKIKKPVRFSFLDFSTVEARAEACMREVQLNRRLSPDVYLGVLDVVGTDGRAVEHMVEMRRMPPERRLATLVAEDAPDVADVVRSVAHRIAAFHAAAARGAAIDDDASHHAVAVAWVDNISEITPFAVGDDPVFDVAVLDDVRRLAVTWIEGRRAVFDERLAGGHAVDGHGDILAEDVFCLADGPRILDCIEFDDHLRHVDVWNDVAFLAMDLERLGRPDLAAVLTDTYREMSADSAPHGLVHLFIAYRALVRAKVAALRSLQTDGIECDDCVAEARARLEQCRRHLRAAQVRLVLVGGLPGVGKSTLAAELADELDATVLSSDPTRRELVGVAPGESAAAAFGEGAYTNDVTDATYAALLERAAIVLGRGGTVVLDASWVEEGRRAAARELAEDAGAVLVELHCTCPAEVAAARMAARAEAGGSASDADAEVAARMAADADPWPEAHVVDTGGEPAAVLDRALALVRDD
jgi:aminoglycoside phosphotransferase family enzyme/predicted kinase